jgi:hypothetical protein
MVDHEQGIDNVSRALVPGDMVARHLLLAIETVTDVRNGWGAHRLKGYPSDARVVRGILDAPS